MITGITGFAGLAKLPQAFYRSSGTMKYKSMFSFFYPILLCVSACIPYKEERIRTDRPLTSLRVTIIMHNVVCFCLFCRKVRYVDFNVQQWCVQCLKCPIGMISCWNRSKTCFHACTFAQEIIITFIWINIICIKQCILMHIALIK